MPTNIEIKQLFTYKRFPENEFKVLCLLLYLPVGLIVLALRAILASSALLLSYASSDLPIVQKLVTKTASLCLGVSVTVENANKKEDVDVFVSNSASIFDQLAVHIATRSVSPANKNHAVLAKSLGTYELGSPANLDAFRNNVMALLSTEKVPVHFMPEEKITNGKALLSFKTYPFALSNKVQPICISIKRPLLDIAVTTLGATYWTDVLFYMFSPSTNYTLKFLTPLEKKSRSDEEFAEIVRQNIASGLTVEVSDFSASDLIEWEKRKVAEQQRSSITSRSISTDSNMRRMAVQVKEVLPHVPLTAIYKDLNKTKSVDATITNILEGRVYFIPEVPRSPYPSAEPSTSGSTGPSTSASPSTPSASTMSPTMFNTAASSFARSAQERNKSFQERKDQLIASARQRYIEKQNLDIPL